MTKARAWGVAVVIAYALGGAGPAGSQANLAQLVREISPAEGGPERIPGVLAVSPTGHVAFTFGYDSDDRHVTVIDSTGRLVGRLGTLGSGPGEFRSVLRVFFSEDRLLLYGVGQVSMFRATGRHEWSRAVPPLQYPVGLAHDSLDMVEIRHWADGRGVGNVYRRSLARGGDQRLVVSGSDSQIRALAASSSQAGKFERIAVASSADAVAFAHPHTTELVLVSADGTTRRQIREAGEVRRRTPDELEEELDRVMARAAQPFRLPDGSTRPSPVNRSAMRARLAGPMTLISQRDGGLHVDPTTNDVFVVMSEGATTRVVRYARSATREFTVACDLREGSAAVAWPYLALTCVANRDGEPVPVVRLYRMR